MQFLLQPPTLTSIILPLLICPYAILKIKHLWCNYIWHHGCEARVLLGWLCRALVSSLIKETLRVGETAQLVKCLHCKLEDLSYSPRTHMKS